MQSGTFAMAWGTAKLTEPARLLVTVWATPKIAVRLGYAAPLPKGHGRKLAKEVLAAGRAAASTAAQKASKAASKVRKTKKNPAHR